ncbi:MAG: hypothetical protein HKP61_20110 [Dactylosporangium sp.]|nr:hypothetical protein [Dactylosporangium sp.]NNJ63190.1 hypothetical protein [Dactylosporangium sp.]
MRLTVGHLPPMVYWRRRALVLGVLLALTLPLVVRCAASADPPTGAGQATPAASGGSGGSGVSPSPSPSTGAPGETPLPPSADITDSDVTGGDEPGPATLPRQPSASPCSDDDLAVTAGVDPSPGFYGGTFSLSLVIVNVSGRACSRDIGSGPQELRVQQDAAIVWSSDDCDAPQASDVRTFGAGVGVRFTVPWSSHRIAPDTCQVSSTPAPPGTYQALARLGSKLSEPVSFEIRK